MESRIACLCIVAGIVASNAWPSILTNATLNVTQLDGTNGFTLQHSRDPVYWGIGLAWQQRPGDDWAQVCGAGYSVNVRPTRVISTMMDCWAIDGTNGFRVIERFEAYTSARALNWPSQGYYVGGSFMNEATNGPVVVLNPTCEVWQAETSLTDTVWGCTMRYYFTNEPYPLGCKVPAGDFLGTGYAIAGYHQYSNAALVFAVDEFVSGATLHDENSGNVVRFTGPGKPGWDIEPVGDVNGDGTDDLLLGSRESDRCWLLFGGRGWTGSVNLNLIGTNGVAIRSIYHVGPPPLGEAPRVGNSVTSAGDMNHDELADVAYTESGWNDTDSFVQNRVNVVFGRTNLPAVYSGSDLNGFTGFSIMSATPCQRVAAGGDINGDGYGDVVVMTSFGSVLWIIFGGPYIPVNHTVSLYEGNPGFRGVKVLIYTWMEDWYNADIRGDANSDGYADVLFSAGSSRRSTNCAWLVYGGQNLSIAPQLRTPIWIDSARSNTVSVQYYDTPTNIVWTGCKKGDDYCLAFTNGVRCAAYDEPMGVLYFTNSYVLSSSNDQFTIAYTSTNALGSAAGRTTLVIRAVPETTVAGIAALAAVLAGRIGRD